MKSVAKKPKTTTYSLNGHRAFYLREENTVSVEKAREAGKVRVLTAVDLFAGAGGFTLGFVQAGFVPVFAVEFDKASAETYEANFGPHCVSKDIKIDPRRKLWRGLIHGTSLTRTRTKAYERIPQITYGKDIHANCAATGTEVPEPTAER